MKKLSRLILPLVMAILAIPAMQAEQKRPERPSREQFTEAQAKKIAEELKLDDNKTKQFITTFTQCQKEIWAANPRDSRKQRNTSLTDDEARQIIKNRFAHRQKINDIQEKYYAEYSKFLSQNQILRVYDLEKQMMDNMFRQRMNRRNSNSQGKGHGKHRGAPPCNAPAPCTPPQGE